MKKIILSAALFCLVGFESATSHALNVSFVGAYNSTNPSITDSLGVTYETTTIPTYGGGLLLSQRLGPTRFSLETGALYLQRKMGWTASALGIVYANTWTFTDIQVPARLRFWLFRYFSIGAGMVYNFGQGNVTEDQTDYSGGAAGGSFSGQTFSYGDAKMASSDSAYDFSAQLRIPMSMRWSFIVDGNYQIGITNMDTSNATVTKINMLQILAGFSAHL